MKIKMTEDVKAKILEAVDLLNKAKEAYETSDEEEDNGLNETTHV